MSNFKVGDRVVGLGTNIEVVSYVNQIGTVVQIMSNAYGGYCYKVEYDFDGGRIWSKVRPLTLLEKALYEED